MSQKKIWITSAILGSLFFASLGSYVYWQELQSAPSRSASSTKKDKRLLELSKVVTTIKQVPDEPSALFNDPAISQAWGLKKADAARAWSLTKGSREIVVAVIDTGIDIKHEDLVSNLWVNPGESGKDSNGRDKSTNGVDDDGNGFIDDIHGWNFVSENNRLDDNHGHGTHIAGIIGASAGNNKGIIGIAPEVSIMTLKYYDPKVPGADNLKNTVASIRYAVKMGAHIINYSGGGTEFSQEEHDAIKEAESKGILFVAAAGNERSNSDNFHYYPADYELTNIISVTAIDQSTEILSSSNYGVLTVDIAAPGHNILSCLPGSAYGYMTGTSQATAFVTGAAALVMAHKQSFNFDQAKKYILGTGDAYQQLLGKTKTARKLNLFKALAVLDQGVGLSGVVAANTVNMNQEFTNDPNLKKSGDSAAEISSFGRSLLDVMGKTKINRIGTQQNIEAEQ